MAEFLAPGLFIEEIASPVQVVQSVSTSTVGAVGFTPRGPTDKATLVGSFEEYQKVFGAFTSLSFLPLTMAAFFANGGRRAYIVRVVPSDAVSADCKIQSKTTDQLIETGDGATTVFTKTASTSLLKDNAGASPIVPSSVTIRWRNTGTPVTNQQTKKRDGTTNLSGDGATLAFEGRINPSSIQTVDEGLLALVPGTITIEWTSTALAKSITVTAPASGSVSTSTNGAGSAVTFDHKTGRFSLLAVVAEVPDNATAINSDFTPATATQTAVDNGSGTLTGNVSAGTITYADGAYSFTATSAPHDESPILAT
jgi:hypothetical protein